MTRMAERSQPVAPAWLLVMRHAKAWPPGQEPASVAPRWSRIRWVRPSRPPESVLDRIGRAEARDVGGTLASVLDDLRRANEPVQVSRFVHENTKQARATAQALTEAFEQTAAALEQTHGERPPPLPSMVPIGREVPSQALDATFWLQDTVEILTAAAVKPPNVRGAALIVGHEPGMSWLVTHLLGIGRSALQRRPDVPALARAELLALQRRGNRWQPMWALTSDAKDTIAEVTAKIRSKMDTAKVFGGFVTALLTFVASQYATTKPSTLPWAIARGVSLTALGVAVLFYLMTLFWYDRLLMPTRFWSSPQPHSRRPDTSTILLRPPSSAVWVLYQNMQRTWRRLFIPATYLAGVGVATFAVARIEPGGATAVALVVVGIAAIAVAAWWGWQSRPILGVQD